MFKFGVKLGLGFTGTEFPPKLDFWNNFLLNQIYLIFLCCRKVVLWRALKSLNVKYFPNLKAGQ